MGYSQQELLRFEALLQSRKAELVAAGETGQDAEQVIELDQARVGRLSRMDALQAQAMSLETGRRRREQILKIDKALDRISAGDYGDCYQCGKNIHPGRLEADPAARLCIRCAEAQEQP